MAVYLLHYDNPTGEPFHYTGFTKRTPEERFKEHATVTKGYTGQLRSWGYKPILVRIWPEGDRQLEKKLKKVKASTRCPICSDIDESK